MAVDAQAAIDALEKSMMSATLTVTFEGVTHTYRSMADLKEALGYFKNKLAEQSTPATKRVKTPGTLRAVFERN